MLPQRIASLAVAALAGGALSLVGAPTQAIAATAPPASYFPACSTTQDPGGPCLAAVYGWGDYYSNGFENCRLYSYNQLSQYQFQGYRTASCQLQNYYPDSYTLLVLYK
ncbi:hypothetical protein MRQ36_28735 [Micromonospora sp. R77]|uniref:hypothetical protein n=1 Tax=Micromonospora sp. R77 TaxID=2925836 RepID=UPI001F60368E|nr:hypothetical protein [Micromonospora sp. R77]MCI4066324.1 hypothetical protein [Micromonospora sp. R77]